MLAGRQGLPRHPGAQVGIALHVLRQQVVFQPLDLIRPQRLHHAHGVFHVQRQPRVHRQLDVGADLLSRSRDQLDVLVQPGQPGVRPMAQEDLDRLEAQLEVPFQIVAGLVVEHGVGGITENAVLDRAAEQFVHRPAQQLPFQVPERVINGADGVAGHPDGAVWRGGAPHHVPQLLGRHGVLPIQQLGKVIVDDRADRSRHVGEAQPPGAIICGDDTGRARPAITPATTGHVVGVPIHRADEVAAVGVLGHSWRGRRIGRQVYRYRPDLSDVHSSTSLRRVMEVPTDAASGYSMPCSDGRLLASPALRSAALPTEATARIPPERRSLTGIARWH